MNLALASLTYGLLLNAPALGQPEADAPAPEHWAARIEANCTWPLRKAQSMPIYGDITALCYQARLVADRDQTSQNEKRHFGQLCQEFRAEKRTAHRNDPLYFAQQAVGRRVHSQEEVINRLLRMIEAARAELPYGRNSGIKSGPCHRTFDRIAAEADELKRTYRTDLDPVCVGVQWADSEEEAR